MSQPRQAAVLSALRFRPFRFLAAGRFAVMFGNAIAPIALAFAVLDLTGSVTDLGLVVGARSLANVVFLLFGGVVSDRLPRQVILIATSVIAALTQAGMAAAILSQTVTIPYMIVLSAINGMVTAFAFPASMAIVPQTVPDEARKQANAINRFATSAALMGGSATGGMIVAAVGPAWGLAVNAATFIIAALLFAFVRVSAYRTDASGGRSVLRDLREGWTEFARHTWVWTTVIAFMFFNMAVVGAVHVLGPAIADDAIGRRMWGIVLASETAGMAVGAIVAMTLRVRRMLLFGVICSSGAVFFQLGLAIAPHAAVLVPAAFTTGLVVQQFNIAWDTSLQDNIPPDRLARVYSYDSLGSLVAIPLGQVAVGPLSVAIGASESMLVAAGVVAVAVFSLLASRSVRTLEHFPGATGASPPPATATVHTQEPSPSSETTASAELA
jgi:MFS family permease